MEIKVILQTTAGNVTSTYTPSQVEMALDYIRQLVADGKHFYVYHQAA